MLFRLESSFSIGKADRAFRHYSGNFSKSLGKITGFPLSREYGVIQLRVIPAKAGIHRFGTLHRLPELIETLLTPVEILIFFDLDKKSWFSFKYQIPANCHFREGWNTLDAGSNPA